MLTKDDLLLYLCKETARVPAGGYDPNIYSIPRIAEELDVTKYAVRKCMKELEKDELVRKTYEGGIDEDGYPHCYHGWSISEKAYNSELYKKCEKEAYKEYDEWQQKFDEKWQMKNGDVV